MTIAQRLDMAERAAPPVRITRTILNGPDPCPYLPNQLWAMQYAEIAEMNNGDYTPRLLDGWFKFGSFLQKPVCHWCRACRSMRVPLAEWKPNRTQRRVLRKNEGVEVRIASPPVYTRQRVLLYNRYRGLQRLARGWGDMEMTRDGYLREFIRGPRPMTEVTVWEKDKLLAVLMMDDDDAAMTSVTHFYEPALRKRSIGLFIVLQSFLHAQALGKKYLYLGYYVPGSPTMGYKIQFQPCELRDWKGTWRRLEERPSPTTPTTS